MESASNREDPNMASSDAGWRSIGLPDRAIAAAKSAFGSPDRAKPWVDALNQYVPKPDVLRGLVNAGIGPAEFIRWRRAFVDSYNIVSWSKVLRGAGLGPAHVERWRAAQLNVPTLPLIAPYVSEEFDFDTVLDVLDTWDTPGKAGTRRQRADELLRVLQAGIGVSDLVRFRRAGVLGDELLRWCASGVPVAEWGTWIALAIPADSASRFLVNGVAPDVAHEWLNTGLSAAEALALIDRQVSFVAVREWADAGVTGSDAASFLAVGASVDTARQWTRSITKFSAEDCADLIKKGVSLPEALEFERRGIWADQVTRTEAGLELDLEPWQEDPADALPDVIEAGEIRFTLWTAALGGDPVAHDIAFDWDGQCSATWYEDISMLNDLSFASSSPTHGVLAWPNGHDVELTYTWSELGLEGHDRFPAAAPMSGRTSAEASDPGYWIGLGEAILDFVLLTLGSGGMSDENLASEYYNKVGNTYLNLHEMLAQYVAETTNRDDPHFDQWLADATKPEGDYEISEGESF